MLEGSLGAANAADAKTSEAPVQSDANDCFMADCQTPMPASPSLEQLGQFDNNVNGPLASTKAEANNCSRQCFQSLAHKRERIFGHLGAVHSGNTVMDFHFRHAGGRLWRDIDNFDFAA